MILSAGREAMRFLRSLNDSIDAVAIDSFAIFREVPLKLSPTGTGARRLGAGTPAAIAASSSYESISVVRRMA
jgi:hypothetical protein